MSAKNARPHYESLAENLCLNSFLARRRIPLPTRNFSPCGERRWAMKRLSRPALGALTLLLVGTVLAAAATRTRFAYDGAVIVNSGSTNTAPFTIALRSNGEARVRPNGPRQRLDAKLVAAFFTDIEAARDEHTRHVACMKSASFGSSTFVHWHGWISPDLLCPVVGAAGQRLVADVRTIVATLHIQTFRRRVMHLYTNEPRRAVPSPSASPQRVSP